LNVSAEKYLEQLREKLATVSEYATNHSEIQKNRYVNMYDKRARDKHFDLHEKCLILMKEDTSSSMFSRWLEPAEVVEIKSPYSYVVKYNEKLYHLHANKLRKFIEHTEEITCNNCMYGTSNILELVFTDMYNLI